MELTKEVVQTWIDTNKVSLDHVWEMVGYSSKRKAKDRIIKELEEGQDYLLSQTVKQVPHQGGFRTQNVSNILMTLEGFKVFAASAHTEKGKEVRRYLVRFEQENKQTQKTPRVLIAEALLLADKEMKKQALQIEEMKPKAEFFDAVTGSKNLISMQEVSKVLAIKGLGRNNLFQLLRDQKVLFGKNEPYQKYVDCGYFKIIESRWEKNGDIQINLKTMVSQKGLNFIRKMIEKAGSNG